MNLLAAKNVEIYEKSFDWIYRSNGIELGEASMKKILAAIMLASSLLLSGCYTSMAVHDEKYWAVPIAVPADVVLFPGQVFLMSMFCGWKD